MPKLELFVPCEKVLVDQNRLFNLITVLETVMIGFPEGTEVPENAFSEFPWQIAISWRRQPGDEGRHWEQNLQIVLPNGDTAAESMSSRSSVPTLRVT
jgi:hypothetical protein